MTKIPMGFVALALSALAAGCAGNEDSSRTVGAELRAPQAALPAVAKAAPRARFEPITGVTECDELLHVYGGCVRKRLQGEEQSSHAARFAQLRAATSERAKAGEVRETLAQECKLAFEELPSTCVR